MASYKNILFNKPNGVNYPQQIFKPVTNDATGKNIISVKNGAVMVVGYIPTIGDTIADTRYGIGSPTRISPFNANMAELYIKLKSKAYTLGNYSAADVGKALIALDSLYGLMSELDVDINALSEYSFSNVAQRGMIQQILWRDPSTAQKNIADIITRRNNLASKLKVLPYVPAIPFLQDHIDWARFIYKDDNLDKSSWILFRRSGYYRWETLASDTHPGRLVLCDATSYTGYTTIDHSIIMAEDKMNIIEKLVHDYSLDDDFLDLCTGIANAYGLDSAKYNIPMLPEDTTKFKLELKFDLDVIDSLRSADFFVLDSTAAIKGIDEDTEGHLKYSHNFDNTPDGYFTVTYNTQAKSGEYRAVDTGESRILLSYEDAPTDEAIETIVRYVHDYVHPASNYSYSQVFGLKTEFLTGIRVWYLDTDLSYKYVPYTSFVDITVGTAAFRVNPEIPATFNSFPMIYNMYMDGNGYIISDGRHFYKDIDNLGLMPRTANSTLSERFMWNKFFKNSGTYNKKKSSKSADQVES